MQSWSQGCILFISNLEQRILCPRNSVMQFASKAKIWALLRSLQALNSFEEEWNNCNAFFKTCWMQPLSCSDKQSNWWATKQICPHTGRLGHIIAFLPAVAQAGCLWLYGWMGGASKSFGRRDSSGTSLTSVPFCCAPDLENLSLYIGSREGSDLWDLCGDFEEWLKTREVKTQTPKAM